MDEQLSNIARNLQKISKDWPEKRRRCGQVLDALLQLTIDYPEKAEEGFTNIEIHEFISSNLHNWGISTETDEVRRKVTNAWKDLEALWVKKENGIAQRFVNLGSTAIPKIYKVLGGGGGISNRYSLRLEPIKEVIEQAKKKESLDSNELEYFEDDVDELKGAAKIFASGFLLGGIRKWLFLGVMMLVTLNMLVLLFVFSLGISQQETSGQVVRFIGAFVFILWVEWSLFGAFIQVVGNRVQVAPWWTQPWSSEGDWLLVFEKNKPASPNVIKLKRYTAKCSTCGGVVRVHKGGFTYLGRLVGRCDNSPREHVFSFDHYLRIGASIGS
ncbi:hypothetical protein [uncultured Cycloclasticus sp.]|uniref:hypothetical protein n=1 Tax=uncultured Cycloclasticus sp. TaxID=172194 RepID=UPI002582A295|nr:hypothetical protein [uncultured Cycloclasticus sp.]